MPKSKSRVRVKRRRPHAVRSPKLLDRLPIPEEKIRSVAQKTEASILRLIFGTQTETDASEVFTVFWMTWAMCDYVAESDEARKELARGISMLDKFAGADEETRKYLGAVVLDVHSLCADIWRQMSVEEFANVTARLRSGELQINFNIADASE